LNCDTIGGEGKALDPAAKTHLPEEGGKSSSRGVGFIVGEKVPEGKKEKNGVTHSLTREKRRGPQNRERRRVETQKEGSKYRRGYPLLVKEKSLRIDYHKVPRGVNQTTCYLGGREILKLAKALYCAPRVYSA